jgi:pimeloyl-ACP methyl ester carboxylesterase
VLVHDIGADRSSWDGVFNALAARFQVTAIDRRGRGLSTDERHYSLDREAESDLLAVVNSFKQPVSVVAHGYGAALAVRVSALAQTPLRALVLYEGGASVGVVPWRPDLADRIDALVEGDRATAVRTYLFEAGGAALEEIELLARSPSWPSREAAAPTIGREVRALEKYDVRQDQRKQFKTPTLLLFGSKSSPALRSAMESLGTMLGGVPVTTLEGHGHFAMDTGSELLVRHITRFLDTVD